MTEPDRAPPTVPRFGVRPADAATLEHGLGFTPRFDADGLIPAIVSDAATGEVLMFAWMNAEALARTIDTREAWFWSRSRGKFWRKGEDSGNTLSVVEMRTDCDQDVVWIQVTISGAGQACHTGARSCFYRAVALGGGAEAGSGPVAAALEHRGDRPAPPKR
jgi:phosphoribosyl-AMP cyclohydrolase